MLRPWESGRESAWLETFRVRTPFAPWYSEIDSYGHVSNVHYCRYFEMGRMHYFSEVGDPEPVEKQFPFAHVVAEQRIRFMERCFYDEKLLIVTKIAEFGRSSATLEQAIVDESGTMRAVAVTVIVRNNGEESKAWTAAQREAVGKFEGFQNSGTGEF